MFAFIKKRRVACLLLAAILAGIGIESGLSPYSVSAEAAKPESSVDRIDPPANLDDTGSLTSFIDGIMEKDMDRLHLPGAVLSIVKDGRILLAKGYGSANLEKGSPVDPETSLFRIASTSKLFTWTAVMQLVEQGKIDLDADVNAYLKSFKVPDTYPGQPVTMRHLMTHTAGFEEGGVGYQITVDPAELPGSISETLVKHRLARVRPPGEMASYSNYGATLAGFIVEEVSGISYEEYIKRNLFDPLDMNYATVQEPLPEALEPYKAIGYTVNEDGFTPGKPTYEAGFRPAGSGSVSAVDMAHFMIAHLQNGRYEDKRILQEDTAKLMHSPAFQFDKRMPGVNLGFYEKRFNGLNLIAHGGSDPYFNTELYLAPAEQVGLFVSYNGGQGTEAAESLAQAFFDRYYPSPDNETPVDASVTAESIRKYAGSYQFTRRNFSHIDKFFNFFMQINVSASDNKLSLGSGSEQELYVADGPNLFRQVGGSEQIGFRTNDSGKITYMLLSSFPDMPLEPTPFLDRNTVWFVVLGFSGLMFIASLLEFVFRRRRIKEMPVPQKRILALSAVTSGWALASVLTIFAIILSMDTMKKLSGISTSLSLSLILPIVTVGLTLALLVSGVWVWKNNYWSIAKRVHYSLVASSAAAVSFFFYHWNLLGWQFG